MAPIPAEIKQLIDKSIAENVVMIFSKSYCPFCKKVKALFESLGVAYNALELDIEANGEAIQAELANKTGQKTVPNVFIKGNHVGGADSVTKAHSEGKLLQMLRNEAYDYDLFVIGGGSGGLSCSKEAASLGAKVAVCDFVKPTPKGTSWGLGGTCVNVGCIPKKLMHQASLLGEMVEDSKKFGWEHGDAVKHNWETMKTGIQNHIGSLNWGYRVQLREKSVKYYNAFAELVDQHTVKLVNKTGKEEIVTADKFVIATGERPRYPNVAAAKEHCITSDDLFSLPYCPGKTLVIGASYVALECAGFLKGIGLDVTVMVRSIFLRGFDQDMAEKIGAYMEKQGIRILRRFIPTEIEKLADGEPGRYRVSCKNQDTGEELVDEYNTILLGIGRVPCTSGIGLEKVGVKLNESSGKVIADDYEQTSVPNIYAVGDILQGKPELTPVAIQAGKLLARRLFANATEKCDYINVPTTVFTPLEYGACGYSEEAAMATFGEDNIEVYHTNFQPLEFTVAEREANDCYGKLICNKADDMRVVGFHVLTPNAGEVTQGFGIALKMGAKKKDFDNLIGIHPTNAEIFTTLDVTRNSGMDTAASGC
eukprot:gene6227-6943_t